MTLKINNQQTESRFGISKFGIPIEIRRVPYGIELGSVTLKINNQQRDAAIFAHAG